MKKRLALLLLVPLTLVSCGHKGVSFAQLKAHIDTINDDDRYPFYRAIGSLDLNGAVTTISEQDGTFDKMPNGTSFVPHARYNKGYYNPNAYDAERGYEEPADPENPIINPTSSMSYWLRAPIKVNKDNFYAVNAKGKLDPTCAYKYLLQIISIWANASGATNASSNQPYFEILPNGGFALGGDTIRTKVMIDNYPCYPDPATSDVTEKMLKDDPFPCYYTEIDGRFNIRFEYDANGWLQREYLATSDYKFTSNSTYQVACEAIYVYEFGS